MNQDRTFGEVVRDRRKALTLTQRDVADRVAKLLKHGDRRGFDVTYLSKIENGRLGPPSSVAIQALAAVLEVEADGLLALAGKAPADLGENLKASEGARTFFRSAVNMKLSEKEWKEILESLRKKREKP